MININFTSNSNDEADIFVIFIDETLSLDQSYMQLDHKYNGTISKFIQDEFKGKYNTIKKITTSKHNEQIKHIFIVGLGDKSQLTQNKLEILGGKIYRCTNTVNSTSVNIIINENLSNILPNAAIHIATGLKLSSYKFDKYITKTDEEKINKNYELTTHKTDEIIKQFNEESYVLDGVFLAKNYINEPANILTTEEYASRVIEDIKHEENVDVEIFGEKELEELGAGGILAVGQGSVFESKMIVMRYQGADALDEQPLAFVGKGVVFDSGGLSLKPAEAMTHMKYDMSGSGIVVGIIKALAKRKAKVNAVGIIGLAENMPDGNAQRPGDIITMMSKKTVEVLNTDAEGRLVLADALWYAQQTFNPKLTINLATLTGAIQIALGHTFAGGFTNNEEVLQKLRDAGNKVGEKIWHMPMDESYDKMLKSDIADICNIPQAMSRLAGSSTAAHFLSRFINDSPWIHLDLAGVAWKDKSSELHPKGSTAFGVRAINQLVKDYYEK